VAVIVNRVSELVTDHIYFDLGDLVPHRTALLKLEGMNPAGSVKLKTAVGLVSDAQARHGLTRGARLIESSSGNLGVALSMVCAERGFRFTCVCDPNTSLAHIDMMRALHAEVVVVEARDSAGGYLGTRIAYICSRVRADRDLLWLDQYANPANLAAHVDTTAAAIDADVPGVDYVFVGAGSTGTAMGCVRYFRAAGRATKVVAVDSAGSVTFGGAPGPRHVPGIGASVAPRLGQAERPHEVVVVDELAGIAACRRMATRLGVLLGGSTGLVMAALEWYGRRVEPGARLVAVSADFGDRYLANVYDDGWVLDRFGAAADSVVPGSGVRLAAMEAVS
jgi:2,3-diaminopropionate biosynthesis protein SbnA